jgi:hypothetical protein
MYGVSIQLPIYPSFIQTNRGVSSALGLILTIGTEHLKSSGTVGQVCNFYSPAFDDMSDLKSFLLEVRSELLGRNYDDSPYPDYACVYGTSVDELINNVKNVRDRYRDLLEQSLKADVAMTTWDITIDEVYSQL